MVTALKSINRNQHARGPDGSGMTLAASSGIGMVRLRMRAEMAEPEPIPLGNECFAAYNGEVYWDGVTLPEGGMGEVLTLVGDQPEAVDGMFAIATLDRRQDNIRLQRDRFGIKPLYKREIEGGVAVASTIRGLIGAFGRPSVRHAAIEQFLAFGRPLDGGSFFDDISEVPRGTQWVMTGGQLVPETSLHAMSEPRTSFASEFVLPKTLRVALQSSLQRVQPSTRAMGLAVSGGLDSTILADQLAEMGVEDLRTVSIRVAGSSDGISNLSQLGIKARAAQSWTHTTRTVTPESFAHGVERAAAQMGEPSRMSSIPLYAALADCAADAGIVMLLVGEGADELFMGYSSYAAVTSGKATAISEFLIPSTRCPYLDALMGPGFAAQMKTFAHDIYPDIPAMAPLDRLRQIELDHSLGPLLQRADHLMMARSIEARTPFLHGSVPELALAVPAARHMAGGQNKALLRSAFPEVQSRPGPWRTKLPFRAPITDWLRGPLQSWLDATLRSGEELLVDLGLRRAGLNLVRADLARDRGAAYEVAYTLLSLIFWKRWLDEGANDAAR
ncbi:asparagine synthase-related protein [Halomonas eurihalina]|nr:asparagine synthase-related protein [Halomonas eurihalina]MDR5859273.1 asparagine synthase-related protein [Halomonas eurihalina]